MSIDVLCAKVTHECKLEDREVKFGRRKSKAGEHGSDIELIREASSTSHAAVVVLGRHPRSRPRSGKLNGPQEHTQGNPSHASYGTRLTVATLKRHSGEADANDTDGDHLSVGGRSGSEVASKDGSFRSNQSHVSDSPRSVRKKSHVRKTDTAHSIRSRSTSKSTSPRTSRRKSTGSLNRHTNSQDLA